MSSELNAQFGWNKGSVLHPSRPVLQADSLEQRTVRCGRSAKIPGFSRRLWGRSDNKEPTAFAVGSSWLRGKSTFCPFNASDSRLDRAPLEAPGLRMDPGADVTLSVDWVRSSERCKRGCGIAE
jgi:hypothetical protein